MRLRELNAQFIQSTDEGHRLVGSIEDANGISFQCPKCAQDCEAGVNECRCDVDPHEDWCGVGLGHRKGAHHVICWFRNPRRVKPVLANRDPGPGRWWISSKSTSIDDLTFEHGEPHMPKSVLLQGGCGWHGFISNGEASLS